jgi:hypothetical protein
MEETMINKCFVKIEKGRKSSENWKYFGFLTDESGKEFDAQYKYCKICFDMNPKKIKK